MTIADVTIKVLVPALLLGLPARADEPGVPLRVAARKPDDRVVARLEEGCVVLTVTSPSGIGGATVTRTGDRWPGRLVLRLRLGGLEQCQVDDGKVTLTVRVSSHDPHETSLSLSETDRGEIRVDRRSPLWTEVRTLDARGHPTREFPLKGGWFEFTLPQHFYSANPPSLTMKWVDFFR